MEERDIKDRLDLIESMIAEGRRTTESWGWTFVLWGIAYYVAIAWASWGHPSVAWPVTMTTAGIATAIIASRLRSRRPETTAGRAMMAIWSATGISIFAVMLALSSSGMINLHVGVAIIAAMLGAANATSSIILKWKLQFACAIVWWATSVAACLTSDSATSIIFLAALFFCQIVFGTYCMIAESRKHKARIASQGASHA